MSAYTFKSDFSIDADGSPRAYHPNNSPGLDHLANGGRPGNWWGVVTHNGRSNGRPVVQGSHDPYPGFYWSMTALYDSSFSTETEYGRFADAEKIPYTVLPSRRMNGCSLGDYATVINLRNNTYAHAILADLGPNYDVSRQGEGSIALAKLLGLRNTNPRNGGDSSQNYFYIIYRNSGRGNGYIPDLEEINQTGHDLFEDWKSNNNLNHEIQRNPDDLVFSTTSLEETDHDNLVESSDPFEAKIASLGLRYFTPAEFLVKGASHNNPDSPAHGLNTDPPSTHWNNVDKLAEILDNFRHRHGAPVHLLSVYRSPAYNRAIGGANQSRHMEFDAADFYSEAGNPLRWASMIRDMRTAGDFRGGIGTYSTFVHVDTRGNNVDW